MIIKFVNNTTNGYVTIIVCRENVHGQAIILLHLIPAGGNY
jgi:hypothetical protein